MIRRFNTEQAEDHVAQTIATHDVIAPDYKLTATPEMRAWEERSMRKFHGDLPGNRVLVAGCGDGRDSRFLRDLGLQVSSFDLSEGMLRIARSLDPQGDYFRRDLRNIAECPGPYDGVHARAAFITSTATNSRNAFATAGNCSHLAAFSTST